MARTDRVSERDRDRDLADLACVVLGGLFLILFIVFGSSFNVSGMRIEIIYYALCGCRHTRIDLHL